MGASSEPNVRTFRWRHTYWPPATSGRLFTACALLRGIPRAKSEFSGRQREFRMSFSVTSCHVCRESRVQTMEAYRLTRPTKPLASTSPVPLRPTSSVPSTFHSPTTWPPPPPHQPFASTTPSVPPSPHSLRIPVRHLPPTFYVCYPYVDSWPSL